MILELTIDNLSEALAEFARQKQAFESGQVVSFTSGLIAPVPVVVQFVMLPVKPKGRRFVSRGTAALRARRLTWKYWQRRRLR